MQVEFLGTAGYHPNETRHTSGVFLPQVGPDDAFLVDAGTGTFRLAQRALPSRLHIFMTHAHLDHSCGLSFLFDIAHGRELDIILYADAKTAHIVNTALFGSLLFPLDANFQIQEIQAQHPFVVAGVKVNTHPLTHPGGCLAYRFDWPAKAFALVTDTAGDGRYFDFIGGVDLLIHERNFPDRLEKLAIASGHCTTSDFVAAAHASQAKQVAATHFNPLTQDDPLLEDDVYTLLPGVISALDEMVLEF